MLNERDTRNYAIIYTLWKEIFGEKPTFKDSTDIKSAEAILYLLTKLGASIDDDFWVTVRPYKSDNRLRPWSQPVRTLIIQVKSETELAPVTPIKLSPAGRHGVNAIKAMIAKKPDGYTNSEWLITLCGVAYYVSHYSGLGERWIKEQLEKQCPETEPERINVYYAAYEIFKKVASTPRYQAPNANEKRPTPCIQYNRLLTLFIGYVNNDLKSADPDYVREVLFDNLGMTEDEARACGLEHLIPAKKS